METDVGNGIWVVTDEMKMRKPYRTYLTREVWGALLRPHTTTSCTEGQRRVDLFERLPVQVEK